MTSASEAGPTNGVGVCSMSVGLPAATPGAAGWIRLKDLAVVVGLYWIVVYVFHHVHAARAYYWMVLAEEQKP